MVHLSLFGSPSGYKYYFSRSLSASASLISQDKVNSCGESVNLPLTLDQLSRLNKATASQLFRLYGWLLLC